VVAVRLDVVRLDAMRLDGVRLDVVIQSLDRRLDQTGTPRRAAQGHRVYYPVRRAEFYTNPP
jgi:hypothetical protein